MEQVHKAEVVAVARSGLFCILFCIFLLSSYNFSQELPEEEFQANINSYFDNFGVLIVYPQLSLTKSITSTTSIHGGLLVDVISAASMRSHYDSVYSFVNANKYVPTKQNGIIDAYTSATKKTSQGGHGGNDQFPDESRYEFIFGLTQFLGETSITISNIFSTEHDYTSESIAGSFKLPLANKNTNFSLGFVFSWDNNFPQTRLWSEKKNVQTFNLGLSQNITASFIGQLELSYSKLSGFLADPYQIITVRNYDSVGDLVGINLYESIVPEMRNRLAAGSRFSYQLFEKGSIQFGYRYYYDDWGIKSHTISGLYQQQFDDDNILLGFGLRSYFQTKSDFFEENYTPRDVIESHYLTVDPKLNSLYSYEIEFKFSINGSKVPFFESDKYELSSNINIYKRHTSSPDWHSGYNRLYALIFRIGIRYLL